MTNNERKQQQIWFMRNEFHPKQTLFTSILLPHPRDPSSLARFLVTDEQCYEFKVYAEPSHHSWFIDQLVVSDGKWYFLLPIDPIFLILPHLQAFHRKVSSLSLLRLLLLDGIEKGKVRGGGEGSFVKPSPTHPSLFDGLP
jgi:hypothetical protein